jgi:hypothetical protein
MEQNSNIRTANKLSENVAQTCSNLGTAVINTNYIYFETEGILHSRNDSYLSVKNPLSFQCPRETKIKDSLCFKSPWNLSLSLKEEHKLRIFDNKMLNRISGHKREEVT